ncbi:MAG: hypothetical protein RMI91_03390 [Gemmatales bacterium]|nr:hypothetical protein [Gemmatales bacterium]MDW7993675.1 hypothetical protein [Gemmatales bacterium]
MRSAAIVALETNFLELRYHNLQQFLKTTQIPLLRSARYPRHLF